MKGWVRFRGEAFPRCSAEAGVGELISIIGIMPRHDVMRTTSSVAIGGSTLQAYALAGPVPGAGAPDRDERVHRGGGTDER